MARQNAYLLGRGYLSSLRLNFQHYLWKEQTGYLLHPSILLPQDSTTHLEIADVGTGTGIFLLDLSHNLPPFTQLDGFDIDTYQAPPKAWLPAKVTINTLDAFLEKLPEELVGKYDVVHIAIFALVVKNNDPGPLLRNLVRMLKPGGYLQWNELDVASRRIIKADPMASAEKLTALVEFAGVWEDKLGPKDWIANLPTHSASAGLTTILSTRIAMSEANARFDSDKSLSTYEYFSHAVLDAEGKGEGAKLREMIGEASRECRGEGVALSTEMVVVIGRKGM